MNGEYYYRLAMRERRGFLNGLDTELNTIFNKSSRSFMEYGFNHKTMGIKKMFYIVNELDISKQDELVKWLLERTRTIKEIDLKLMEMI